MQERKFFHNQVVYYIDTKSKLVKSTIIVGMMYEGGRHKYLSEYLIFDETELCKTEMEATEQLCRLYYPDYMLMPSDLFKVTKRLDPNTLVAIILKGGEQKRMLIKHVPEAYDPLICAYKMIEQPLPKGLSWSTPGDEVPAGMRSMIIGETIEANDQYMMYDGIIRTVKMSGGFVPNSRAIFYITKRPMPAIHEKVEEVKYYSFDKENWIKIKQ